jgi:ribosomal protein S18 acetylase RimI-like enzyme
MTGVTTKPVITIEAATSAGDIDSVEGIFRAFVAFLPIDLGFQDIEGEFARFPHDFIHLLLAKKDDTPIGAVALKDLGDGVCEMKRLYVLPEGQGTGAGRALCERLLADAKARGFHTMYLDSLRRLEAAVALYHKLGFTEIEPYNFNPEDDVIYMKRAL